MTLRSVAMEGARKIIPEWLKKELKIALGVPNMEASLANMRQNGFYPRTIIDIGAYIGDWTRMCSGLFPDARILMIEPQEAPRQSLIAMTRANLAFEFCPALVGPAVRTAVPFYGSASGSSIFIESGKADDAASLLPMTTLDEVTKDTAFSNPEFIKLDVQGAELSVLEGGRETLRSAEAVLMEVNLLAVYQDVPLFDRAVAFMADRGFRVYDICTFFRRPLDNALWQTDLIFVRSSSQLVSSNRWS